MASETMPASAEERLSYIEGEGALPHLSTKSDITKVKVEIADSKARAMSAVAEVKAEGADSKVYTISAVTRVSNEVADVRKELVEPEARLLRWIVGLFAITGLGILGFGVSIIMAMLM